MNKSVFEYVQSEINSFETTRVPLTKSKDWSMREHIERCLAVSSGFFFSGKNDGVRPYNDIVTPVIDVAFRSEGFDVKDIVPYVDDADKSFMSFLVKKFHPQWARENELDTFIDEVVESSIIYDLVIVKDVNNVRPECVNLQDIAFCDQTDALSGPLCLRHQYSVSDLLEYKGKWIDDKIDEVITMAKASKKVSTANNQEVKTPGKYIECYELHGSLPESWLYDDGDPDKYVDQMHIINYYTSSDGNKNGITLYKGKSKKISDVFKQLKIDVVRSKGRACGRSIVERLFEPQVWNNYSAIKLKKMLDSAVNLLQTDSEEYGNKKVSELKENTIIKHEAGKPITRIDMGIQNIVPFTNLQVQTENQARLLGSASDAALGRAPVSGTPFALQDLIVQQGEGIHEYRRGKIATFFADVLYRDLILNYLVKEMNQGKKFSEELSLEEMQEISENIITNASNQRIIDLTLDNKMTTPEQQVVLNELYKASFMKGGNRKFFEIMKGELTEIPIKVKVNVAGKQKDMAKNAEKLTNLLMAIMKNPQAFSQIPGIAKVFNQLLEESGMSAIDFTQITQAPQQPATSVLSPMQPIQGQPV